MSKLQEIIKWIHLYQMKLGVKPKSIPISKAEINEIISDCPPYVCELERNRNQIYGIDVEVSPWAEMTRQKIPEIGVERLSMDQRIDESRFRISEYKSEYTSHLVRRLTAEILADVTHLDVSFDWDYLAWIKRKVGWIGRKWPVKQKTVRIEGKVLYPYLKIQAPADTHRVRFALRPQ